jgi:ABC-type multidrug transport system fused ATPase/permease subunit
LPINSTESQLVKLFESNFDSAKLFWLVGIVVDVFSAILSISIIFTKGSITTAIVSAIVFFIILSSYIKIIRKRIIANAEDIRTTHLIDSGLGNTVSQMDVEQYKEMSNGDSIRRFRNRPDRTAPYYDVNDPNGPNRLLAMLHEAAFFSWKIAKHARLFYMGMLLFPLYIMLSSLFLILIFPKNINFNSSYIQIVQIILSSLIGFGIVESIITFSNLIKSLGKLNTRLTELRRRGVSSRDEAITEAWKYAIIQSHGEIIPNKLFRNNADSILIEWNTTDADIRRTP